MKQKIEKIVHRYHFVTTANGITFDQTWTVGSEDAVFIKEAGTGKQIVTGYNHSRAWHACLNAARGGA